MELVSKGALLEALTKSNRGVSDWYLLIPAAEFFARDGDAWSASENLDHLIRVVQPITTALKLPKSGLGRLFGKAAKPSRPYEEMCEDYHEEIRKGAKATGRYVPIHKSPGKRAEERKMELLKRWNQASTQLVAAAEGWNEAELDEYQLPHPILGKVTVREMLFFTIYHNRRHATRGADAC